MNKNLTEEEFDELIYDNEEQVLMFFYKEGCEACRDVLLELEKLEGLGGCIFVRADVVMEKRLFSRLGLNRVPLRTLLGRKTQSEYKSALEFHGYLGESVICEEMNNGKRCNKDIRYFADAI